MPRKKKNITVVVESLNEDGKKEFKKKVNDVYCDMVREKLIRSGLNTDDRKRALDELRCALSSRSFHTAENIKKK